jgi:hypothetical protein
MKGFSLFSFVTLFIFLGLATSIFANTKTDNLFIETRGNYAVLMAHRPNIQGYPNAHFGMYELNLGFKTDGSKVWHQLYHRPNVGFSIFYTNIGKNIYTGSAAAGLAFIQFPYARFKRSQFNFKLALGPGWVEKKFDRMNNYKNLVTGTHLNAAIQLTQSYEIELTPKQHISMGVCLTHFSNGAYKLPNLGINLAGIQVGYQYKFNDINKPLMDTVKFARKMKYVFAYSCGLKQVYPVQGKQYFLSNFSATIFNNYKEKGSVGLLFDLFKDDSVINQMKFDTDSTNNNKTNLQVGIGGVYEIAIDRFTIPLAAGFYVYNNYKVLPVMYLKFALNYYITKQIHVSFNLKSHYAKADYFSYGLGYRF